MDMDDENVYKMIGDGRTSGVFQLESAGMTQFMKDLQPTSLEDIIAGISLYRPGPMDQIPRYIRNKNNPKEVKYHHPLLEKILDVTYGCMVYQEQVMQIVRELAGYSMGRSDLVRRAMAKKKVSVMEQERQNFIYGITDDNGNILVNGAVRNGVDEKTANIIFDEMMDFASYAFNKSHAAAYAVIGYQTAWLKYFYPVEYMAALLNSFVGSSDKISEYVHECSKMKIVVLPPDINESNIKFTVVSGKIRFGMAAIKNVGENAVRSIIEEREINGEYKGFGDFCERIGSRDINKRCVESLIKCGAFSSFGIYRSKLAAVYEKMIDGIQATRKRNMQGQLSIFELSGNEEVISNIGEEYPDIKEYPTKMLLSMEKEMLGLYISGHPLSEYENEINRKVNLFSKDLNLMDSETIENTGINGAKAIHDGMAVSVGGIIVTKKSKTTKSNNLMAFITLEDLYGTMEVIVFPAVLSRFSGLVMEENVILVNGRISMKEEETPKIIADTILPLKTVLGKEAAAKNRDNKSRRLYLKINDSENAEFMESLCALLDFFSGSIPVSVYDSGKKPIESWRKKYSVSLNKSLIDELIERLGEENVKII
jgi:DNA polymerase-3 subunit alpha